MKQSMYHFLTLTILTILLTLPCSCSAPEISGKDGNSGGPETGLPSNKTNVKKAENAPDGLSGKLRYKTTSEMKVEMISYNGKLTIADITKTGSIVKKGDILVRLKAPDLEESARDAESGLNALKLSLASLSEEYNRKEKSEAHQLGKVKHGLIIAEQSLEKWNAEEKTDHIRSSEMYIERLQNRVDDQKDELAQLDKLYKGNELAIESQDIVLKRSRRALRRTKETLEMEKRTHKRMLKYSIPKIQQEKEIEVESAKLALAKILKDQKYSLPLMKTEIERMKLSKKKAQKKLNDLKKDGMNMNFRAPFNGIVLHGPFAGNAGVSAKYKKGDKTSSGTVLVSVVNPTVFVVTIPVPVKSARTIAVGRVIKLNSKALGIDVSGKVQARGLIVTDGKVDIVIRIDDPDGKLMPGISVKATLKVK